MAVESEPRSTQADARASRASEARGGAGADALLRRLAGGLLRRGDRRSRSSASSPRGPRLRPLRDLLWPLAAFSIGLYRSDQLATWASAVTEVPRGFVAVLLITWPLFGSPRRCGSTRWCARPSSPSGIAAFTGDRPRRSSAPACTATPDLRQRTLILGSGVVAGQVVEKAQQQRPVRPRPGRHRRRRGPRRRQPRPALAGPLRRPRRGDRGRSRSTA